MISFERLRLMGRRAGLPMTPVAGVSARNRHLALARGRGRARVAVRLLLVRSAFSRDATEWRGAGGGYGSPIPVVAERRRHELGSLVSHVSSVSLVSSVTVPGVVSGLVSHGSAPRPSARCTPTSARCAGFCSGVGVHTARVTGCEGQPPSCPVFVVSSE